MPAYNRDSQVEEVFLQQLECNYIAMVNTMIFGGSSFWTEVFRSVVSQGTRLMVDG